MATAKTVVNACKSTKWPGKGLCLGWVQDVFDRAGISASRLGAAKYAYSRWCDKSSRADLKPGMIIAFPGGLKHVYGHIGIYIGGGKVMDSETQGICTNSTDYFISAYKNQGYGTPKWGWYAGVALKDDVSATASTTGTGSVPAGSYKVLPKEGLKVRKGAGKGYASTGILPKGYEVKLDGTSATADGYIWGRYTASSGYWRWVAVRSTDGKTIFAQRC